MLLAYWRKLLVRTRSAQHRYIRKSPDISSSAVWDEE
jgi:hypothetical protein